MIVLSALSFLNESRSYISSESIRHVRVIVSLFNEEVLSEDEYSRVIDTLADERYIIKNDRIKISRTGIALVDSLGKRRLGQTYFNRLLRLINGYNREKNEYMKKIGKKLLRFMVVVGQP